MTVTSSLPSGIRKLDQVEQEMVLLIAAGARTADIVNVLDDLTTANFSTRLRRLADKLGSKTVVRSGLVYRALYFEQVEEPEPLPAVKLQHREKKILRGVAQGRMLTRIAEDLHMEDWDLNPIAIQMRTRLGAKDYAHAVWLGWRMRLLDPVKPGLPTGETRSSSQINAAGWMRRSRPSREPGAQPAPTASSPAAGVPPRTGPGAM